MTNLLDASRAGGPSTPDVGLVVRVLGPTRVERDGEVAAIGGPRQRAVLARLVLADRQLVTAERLIDDVWGDDAPRTVVGTLHSHISLLRRALGDGDLLRRDGPGYVLDLPAHHVDAAVFEAIAAEARARLEDDPVAALTLADRALDLWRGPAYADVADTDWGRAAAVRLDGLRLATIELRFDALLTSGQHADAVAELERVVDEHPLHERFGAQQMLALYRAGRQVDALRAFDRTRERLVDELGLEPGPELVRLQAAILGHEAWLASPEPRPATAPAPPPVDDAPAAATAAGADAAPASPVRLPAAAVRHRDRPFVGRDRELARLRQAWEATLAGNRRLVVVAGEAGAGKTRLVSRFVQDVHAEGAIVMWGRATAEALVPYEPFVEGLRTILRTVSRDAQRRVVEGRDALTLLVPDLDELVPDVAVTRPEVGSERFVLFETVADLLESESALWPFVVVLDDLHLADELSLRLLGHMLRHDRPGRVLFVGTVRTLPQTANPALDAFLGDLQRDGMLDRVPVDGLDADGVAELLAAGDFVAGPDEAQAIHRATGGNPFFVTELAAHGSGGDAVLPDSVRDVLGARIDQLAEPTARLVHLAAVAGPVADIPVLASAGGFTGEEVLDAVDDAIAAGLLAEDGPTGSVTFPHALVQQAVLDRLTRSRRCALHLAVADGLQEAGDASAAELAHHLLGAGTLAARVTVVQAAVDAGREAMTVLAYEDADRWARRALDAAGTATLDRLRVESLLLRSDSHRALGDRDAARRAADEAAEISRTIGDPLLLARSAEALALARAGLGFDFGTEDPGLDALLADALDLLPADESDQRARLLGASVTNAGFDGDRSTVERLGELVMRLPDVDAHPALVATTHLARRMSSWRMDLLDERLADDRAARAAAERAGNTALELNALLYGLTDLIEAGEIEEAEQWIERFRTRAGQVRQRVYDAFVLFIDATFGLLRGEYESSAKLCTEALEFGRISHGPNAAQAWVGHVFVQAWDEGRLAELLDVVDMIEGDLNLEIWQIARTTSAVAAGRHDLAAALVDEQIVGDDVRLSDNSLWLVGLGLLVECCRAMGDTARLEVLREKLEPYVGRIAISGLGRVSLGPVARFAGVAAATTGRDHEAAELFTLAEAQCRRLGARPALARTLADHALVTHRLGDHDRAAAMLDEATAIADDIGMALTDLAGRPFTLPA